MNVDDHWKKLQIAMSEIHSTSSDRACVVVAGAFVERELVRILRAVLIKDTSQRDKDLFENPNGALSSFNAKIEMSYRLGLIGRWEYESLNRIRKIRNRFAHEFHISTLEHTEIRDHVINMTPCRKLLIEFSMQVPETGYCTIPTINMQSMRDRFEKSVSCLSFMLEARFFRTYSNQFKTVDDFNFSYEYYEYIANALAERSNALKVSYSELKKVENVMRDKNLKFNLTNHDEILQSIREGENFANQAKAQSDTLKRSLEREGLLNDEN